MINYITYFVIGVASVEFDKKTTHVTVKGTMEPAKLVEYVQKKFGKHAEIVKEDNKGGKEVENNKEKDHPEPIILFSYPPQYSTQYLYPNQTFSDENVFACSIM